MAILLFCTAACSDSYLELSPESSVSDEVIFENADAAQYAVNGLVYIIVKTVFNGRTDTKLNAWIKFLQCFGQQVGTSVPESMFALFVFPFIKNEVCIFIDRAR